MQLQKQVVDQGQTNANEVSMTVRVYLSKLKLPLEKVLTRCITYHLHCCHQQVEFL